MTGHHTRAAWFVGVALFVVAAIPTALVVVAVRSGSIGSVNAPGLIIMAFLVIAALAAATGYLFGKALDKVAASPGRSRADAWVALYVAVTVIVIGAFLIPVGTLAVMVNSDRSLQDNGLWFFVWWIGLHLLVGALAFGLGRVAFWREPPRAAATETG